MSFEQTAKANVDRIIKQSLEGEGPFTEGLQKMYDKQVESEILRNKSRERAGKPQLTEKEIHEAADANVKNFADKQLRQSLNDAIEGKAANPDITADMNKMLNIAGAGMNVANSQGFGMIGALLQFAAAAGEYVMSFFTWLTSDKNDPNAPANPLEAYNKMQAEKKALPALANAMGADANQLMAELNRKPEQNVSTESNKPAAKAAPQEKKFVELDANFNLAQAQAVAQVKKEVEAGNIKVENGKTFATPSAIEVLDALSAAPANTPKGAPPLQLAGKQGSSWASNR